MYLTKKLGSQHLKNWKSVRLGVMFRAKFTGGPTTCEITGLSFGQQEGYYSLPVPDLDRGQTLYFEANETGDLMLVNGTPITFDGVTLKFGDKVLFGTGSEAVGTFEVGLNSSSGLYNQNSSTSLGNFQAASNSGIGETITSLKVSSKVALLELRDSPLSVDYDSALPMQPIESAVFNMREKRALLFNSGRTPTVGVSGNIEVISAPSLLTTVEITLQEALTTTKFTHIVGMSDIGMDLGGVENSIENAAILTYNTYALVLVGGKVVGKFRYAVGDKITLVNVFNVKQFGGDLSSTFGMRYYGCSDNTENNLDALMYKTDTKYDHATGVVLDVDKEPLKQNIPILLPQPIEGLTYGVRITRNFSSNTSTPIIAFTVGGSSYSLSLTNRSILFLHRDGIPVLSRRISAQVYSRPKFHIVFYEGALHFICRSTVIKYEYGEGLVGGVSLPPTTTNPDILDILVYVADGNVVPDGTVFLDAHNGEGFLGTYQNAEEVVSDISIDLPSDTFRELPDHFIDRSTIAARFRGYYVESRQEDAPPITKSKVEGRFLGYFVEYSPDDAPIAIDPIFEGGEMRFYGVLSDLPYPEGEMPDFTLPLLSGSMRFYGVVSDYPYETGEAPVLTLPLVSGNIQFYGIVSYF